MDIPKANEEDMLGRFREVISDPINLLIERVPEAGYIQDGLVTLHNGNRVPFTGPGAYYGGYSAILSLNRGVTEPLEEFVFQQLLKRLPEAPMMIELGAYWAHYSMWLKKARPDAHCVMVEPEDENFEAGKANFERNGYTGEFIQKKVEPGGFTVDGFLERENIDHLDVLHADIQGYEQFLMKFAGKTINARKIDYMFIATHGASHHELVLKHLEPTGYRIEIDSDYENHTTSSDGLIFATAPHVEPLMDGYEFLGRQDINKASVDALIAMLHHNASK